MNKLEIKYRQNQSFIPFAEIRLENLVFLDLTVNGHTAPFLFDTGANMTVINAEFAQKANVPYLENKVKGIGNAGNAIETNQGRIDNLRFGEIEINNLDVAILPTERLTFDLDDKGTQLKINGFLGWDVIQNFKWTVNNLDRTLKVEKPATKKSVENLFFDILPIITVDFNGECLNFWFDSGNTESMLGVNMLGKFQPDTQRTDSITGVDGTIVKNVYDVEEFRFKITEKEISLHHVTLLQQELHPENKHNSMGLLASDIVKDHNWLIDLHNHHFEILD